MAKYRVDLAEAKKDAEEALVVAETREEAFRSREAAAEERTAAAEGRARRWEDKADELGQALSHKVSEHAANLVSGYHMCLTREGRVVEWPPRPEVGVSVGDNVIPWA